jgi:hypothetical protein
VYEPAWFSDTELGYGLDDRGFKFRQKLGIFLSTTGSGVHTASYPMGTSGSFPGGKSGRGVKLTTHLHLVPSLRMPGSIPPLLQYAFMAWCPI